MFIIAFSPLHGQVVRRRMVVANQGERLSLPRDSLPHEGDTGRSWVRSDTSNISGVERKIDMRGEKDEHEEENRYSASY
jgi:hypothetical protein